MIPAIRWAGFIRTTRGNFNLPRGKLRIEELGGIFVFVVGYDLGICDGLRLC